MSEAWPEFRVKAERILAEVLDREVAAEVAGMLARVGADQAAVMRARDGRGGFPLVPGYPSYWREEEVADPDDLTPEERAVVAAQFAAGDACSHCGGIHLRACPRVKRLAFKGSEVAEVEFFAHGDWPTGNVFWPESFPLGQLPS